MAKEIPDVLDKLLRKLFLLRDYINEEDVALALVGFVLLGIRLQASPSSTFLEVLPRTMRYMDAQQVANSVWALGKLEVLWDSLPLGHRKAIGEGILRTGRKMTPQGIANTIHGNKIR